MRNFKALYPAKTVWCYSGYTWEQLTGKEPSLARCEATDELLSLLDVLVDGENAFLRIIEDAVGSRE